MPLKPVRPPQAFGQFDWRIAAPGCRFGTDSDCVRKLACAQIAPPKVYHGRATSRWGGCLRSPRQIITVPLPRDLIALDEECCLHRLRRAPYTVVHRIPSRRAAAWIFFQELSAKRKIGT